MAVFTRLLRRAKISHRRLDRLRIFVEQDGINLVSTREFRLHVPVSSRSDMALGARHSCMGRIEIRGVLRFHHAVANFAAELHRFGELVRLVTSERRKEKKDDNKS